MTNAIITAMNATTGVDLDGGFFGAVTPIRQIVLGMSMALLGGCWWPLELFPPFMQTASKILPTAWAMQGLRDLSMRGLGVNAILPEAAVLLGFAALFFVVGTLRFRYE